MIYGDSTNQRSATCSRRAPLRVHVLSGRDTAGLVGAEFLRTTNLPAAHRRTVSYLAARDECIPSLSQSVWVGSSPVASVDRLSQTPRCSVVGVHGGGIGLEAG